MGKLERDVLYIKYFMTLLLNHFLKNTWKALVIHIFCPLMMRSSPCLLAVVVAAATSLPSQSVSQSVSQLVSQ